MSDCEHCGQVHEGTNSFCPKTGKLMAARLFAEGALIEGKYRVGRTLGVGGMGAVFEATHTLLDKKVALKVLLPGQADEEEKMTARFVREARAASATGHRNITTVTDMGWTDDGSLFVVMEYLNGRTFVDLIDEDGSLPGGRSAGLIMQVLSGLEAVHRKGIIHRDLKPENLMLVVDDDGREVVKILDFGISKLMTNEPKMNLTATGMMVGTPQYMSPEQARSRADIDHRADIYAVGAILYLLLTGRPPIQEETISAQIMAIVQGRVEPPSNFNPEVSREMDEIAMQALARKPKNRFQDAREFYEALMPFFKPLGTDTVMAPSPLSSEQLATHTLLQELDKESLVGLDQLDQPPPAPADTDQSDSGLDSATPNPISAALKSLSESSLRHIDEVDHETPAAVVEEPEPAPQPTSTEPEQEPPEAEPPPRDEAAPAPRVSALDLIGEGVGDGEEPARKQQASEEITRTARLKPKPKPKPEPEPEPKPAPEPEPRPAPAPEEDRFRPPRDSSEAELEIVLDQPPAPDPVEPSLSEPDASAARSDSVLPPPMAPDPQDPAEDREAPEHRGKERKPASYGSAHRRRARISRPVGNRRWIVAAVLVAAVVIAAALWGTLASRPGEVRVRVVAFPDWADIQLDGRSLNPGTIMLKYSTEAKVITASALGYQPKNVRLIPDRDQTVRLILDPIGGGT